MAREINVNEINGIIKAVEDNRLVVKKALEVCPKAEEDVKKAADLCAKSAGASYAEDVPVDVISEAASGIKIKTLKDAGYENLKQITDTSVKKLTEIEGISQDMAMTIKKTALDYLKTINNNSTIRLSVDEKTEENSRLVLALGKYIIYQNASNVAAGISFYDRIDTTKLINDMKPLTGGFSKMFMSSAKKEAAYKAFDTLDAELKGETGARITEIRSALHRAENLTNDEAWADFAANPIIYVNALEKVCPGMISNESDIYGLPEELASSLEEQKVSLDGLKCELRRYQQWGVKYILHQGRVLLGDEMGLGKTVQAIASMVSLRNTGATHFMVVCPASVTTNWEREVQKFSDLPVIVIHGSDKLEEVEQWVKEGGVAITTYETTGAIELAEEFKFSMLTVDEAHYIKNPNAQRSKNVRNIATKAERILFMTGTALENRVDEMISLIDVLDPNIAKSVKGIAFLHQAPKFRETVAPVYFRRKREDVLTELPELIENYEWCNLSKEEKKVYYKTLLGKNFMNVRRVSWNVEDINNSSKAMRLKEIVEEAKEEERKIIVFSFFLDTIQKVQALLGDICYGPINGSIQPKERQEIIDEFNNAPAGSVLLGQIQSAGTGLNIQSASIVVLCEPQFKPSIEDQAISRAYRMGQSRNVLVYRLLCDNTIDEKMTKVLEQKKKEFEAYADESVAGRESIELDDKIFGNMIEEEIERIKAEGEIEIPENVVETTNEQAAADEQALEKEEQKIDN